VTIILRLLGQVKTTDRSGSVFDCLTTWWGSWRAQGKPSHGCCCLLGQVDSAKAAVAEAEAVARQLADAAARARGEVDATRTSLRETTPQLFQAQDLQTQARAALLNRAAWQRVYNCNTQISLVCNTA